MPTTKYEVYASDAALIAKIDEYTSKKDISDSEFFREAARSKLQQEKYLDD